MKFLNVSDLAMSIITISRKILQASGWDSNGVSHSPDVSRRIYESCNRRGSLCITQLYNFKENTTSKWMG